MSYTGEAKAFAREADKLYREAAATPPGPERDRLLATAEDYDLDARNAWQAAKADCADDDFDDCDLDDDDEEFDDDFDEDDE